ncbi:hypothetical protein Dsin_014074 [Dipteronia sinensis]|uniref:Haloacid dehalogenase superfamily protein n=1 Tax=Dipteronia sinensis TaxID=43782 RepID=A0AAE0E9Q0_9ROSI|nr:hypothetical protein Dsin_014074 [Dipteronia sinensis]
MQSTSSATAASSICYCYHRIFHFPRPHRKKKPTNSLSLPRNQIISKHICSLSLPSTSNCSKDPPKHHNDSYYPDHNRPFFDQLYSSTDFNASINKHPEARNEENEGEGDTKGGGFLWGLFSSMWWTELKAAVGQRINMEGIVSSVSVFVRDRHLALPHVLVPDIRYIDWAELHRKGFKGVVFDKDNTITAPYSLTLWGPVSSSIDQCKSVFGCDMAVFSNSSGLHEYDHDGSKARKLEGKIGIKVIRHRVKKPAGTAEEIEKHFGCRASQLIMVGDRPFTDVVFGNRNGFLTILTKPLSLAEEPFIVRQVRKLEVYLVNGWFRRGLKPISHALIPDPTECVKDPPSL